MRNGGPKAGFCSWADLDLDLGTGEDEPLAICRTHTSHQTNIIILLINSFTLQSKS